MVITLLGILLGIVIVVIDVPAQRARSRQAVARSNLDKVCAAFTACLSAQTDGLAAGRCDTFALIGVIDPSGKNGLSNFTIQASGPMVTQDTCTISCDSSGAVTMTPVPEGVCYNH